MPATTRSPRARPHAPMPPFTGPGQRGRPSRTRRHLAAAAGGLLAAGVIVLAAAAASGASPVTGTAATGAHSVDVGNAPGATAALTQHITYRVQQLHGPSWPGPGGPAAAVTVELLDAAGNNVSGPGITLTVTGLSPRPEPGRAWGGTFTPVNLGLWPCYRFVVSTAGYPPGTYTLSFTAGTDPVTHTAQFTVP